MLSYSNSDNLTWSWASYLATGLQTVISEILGYERTSLLLAKSLMGE